MTYRNKNILDWSPAEYADAEKVLIEKQVLVFNGFDRLEMLRDYASGQYANANLMGIMFARRTLTPALGVEPWVLARPANKKAIDEFNSWYLDARKRAAFEAEKDAALLSDIDNPDDPGDEIIAKLAEAEALIAQARSILKTI